MQLSKAKRVVVSYGMVSETRTVGVNGTRRYRHDPPVLHFFVDVYALDGGRAGVWDGASYADALAAARDWVADGFRLDDQVARDAGGAA